MLERADKLGVRSYAFELKEFENKAEYEEAIVKLMYYDYGHFFSKSQVSLCEKHLYFYEE